MINEFYAVTLTSVYRVWVDEKGFPQAQKIAQRAGTESSIKVGAFLRNSTLLAITDRGLQFFAPHARGDRKPDILAPQHCLGGKTSPIAALFRAQAEAMQCLGAEALVPRDARFAAQTNAVLNAIGRNHPVFCVCV